MAVRENGVPISGTRNMESSPSGRSFDNRAEGPSVMSSGVQSGESIQSTGSWRATAPAASSSPVREKRKRIDRSHLMTIEDLLDANKTENKRKMSLGHGLQAIFEENGLIRFQFRLTQNGQDTTLTLGNSGEMTLAAARQEALRLDNEVRNQKRKDCDAGIVAKVKRRNQKNDSGRYPTLKSLDDAIHFMERLFSIGVINPEVKCAIALQVLIPARLGDLLRSKWRDFQPPQNPTFEHSTRPIDDYYSWYIPSPEDLNNQSSKHPRRIVHLSSRAAEVVEWRRRTNHQGFRTRTS